MMADGQRSHQPFPSTIAISHQPSAIDRRASALRRALRRALARARRPARVGNGLDRGDVDAGEIVFVDLRPIAILHRAVVVVLEKFRAALDGAADPDLLAD